MAIFSQKRRRLPSGKRHGGVKKSGWKKRGSRSREGDSGCFH